MEDGVHRIGEVGERLGLSLRTLRYYEEEGLARPSGRTRGGFRLYSDADVERLELIKRMRPLGFSLQEMRELLEARDTLASPTAAHAATDEAMDDLASFADAAASKCAALRAQLATAEGLSAELRRELRRHRRRGRPAPTS